MDARNYLVTSEAPIDRSFLNARLGLRGRILCHALAGETYESGRRLQEQCNDLLGLETHELPVMFYWLEPNQAWGLYLDGGWRTCSWVTKEIRRLSEPCP